MSMSKVGTGAAPAGYKPEARTMEDLPPEVVTKILEKLTQDEGRNDIMIYRLVNPQWKDILDSLIEKRIVSGDFQLFPGMKIVGVGGIQFKDGHVRYSTTTFPATGNPFPFNSLLISGNVNGGDIYFVPGHPYISMSLPDFVSRFGGNLTSFALHYQDCTIKTLASMLSSTPNLKLLKLKDVKHVDAAISPGSVLPIAPPLPSLTTLELASSLGVSRASDNKINILYVWLVASYADQLVRLNLETELPPLQKRHVYSYPLPTGETFPVATTLDSAFGKLKELKISRHSGTFLRFSEIPGLQQLSIDDLALRHGFDMEDLVQFIQRCGETLGELRLDVNWDELLMRQNATPDYLQQLPAGVNCRKLKTLTMHFPINYSAEILLSKMLRVLFPALEVLQIIGFAPNYENQLEDPTEVIDSDDINGLKELLASIQQEMAARTWSFLQDRAAVRRGERVRANQGGNPVYAEIQLLIELTLDAAQREKPIIGILKRLAALGENVRRILVENLLERQGIWNIYQNLKTVSVSSGEISDADICLIRRLDDA